MSQSSSQHQPTLSDCYDELMADPSLLQSFSEDEWMSTQRLPYMCVLHFCIVLERLSNQLTSPALWRNTGANFITNASQRAMSTEFTSLAILVMGGVDEGKLGMITTFCRSNQVKVQPSDTLSTLVQQDSPKPGVLVVKVFTNSPHLTLGSFGSPYLDITTLSVVTLTSQFPFALLPSTVCPPILPQVILL